MFFILAKLYVFIYYIISRSFNIKIRGLGFVQRIVKSDHILSFRGKKIFFNHKIKGSYDCLIIGRPNEPETHKFLSHILGSSERDFSFIDVGASVGEMVFGVSKYVCIKEIYAFEPRKECVVALQQSKKLNSERRMRIINTVVGETPGYVVFYHHSSGVGSGLKRPDKLNCKEETIRQTTLDHELPAKMNNPIILIDVEGHEPFVIKGAAGFINANHPLIVFEYNETSKKYFHISEIQDLLGSNFEIYRLRDDGTLDLDLINTWNCIAVPKDTVFEELVRELIIRG